MIRVKKLIKIIIGLAFKSYCLIFNKLNDVNIILMYHRVHDDGKQESLYDSAMFIRKSTLKMNIEELSKYFDIISIEELVNTGSTKKPTCILTFDDGWADNYYNALPVLASTNVPAAIFITVDYIGKNRNFWFHDIWHIASECLDKSLIAEFYSYFKKKVPFQGHNRITESNVAALISCIKEQPPEMIEYIVNDAYKSLGIKRPDIPTMLNWDQIIEMACQRISIGSHGMNHYILTNIDSDLKFSEITNSLTIMKKQLSNVCQYFCYPNGNYDDETIRIVRQAGYVGAIGTEIGVNTASTDKYRLHRIALHDDIASSVGLLWFRIFQSIH